MRKKLMLLAVLNCAAGGWLLAPTPASGMMGYPDCETLRGTACTTPGATVVCQWEGRYLDGLYCFNGVWE